MKKLLFSSYLFRKLSEIMVENLSITLFRVTTEWYFLPYTILACCMKKKSKIVQGFACTCSPRHWPGPPGGLKLHQDPQLQLFLALPKTDAPIFFPYYPLNLRNYEEYLFSRTSEQLNIWASELLCIDYFIMYWFLQYNFSSLQISSLLCN